MHIQATTPRTAGRVAARRGATLAAAALTGAALLSACGSSGSSGTTSGGNLDTARVALSIEQSILSERHIHAKVTCPVTVAQETGKIFTCTAVSTVTTKGKPATTVTTPFTVTVQNNKGYVTYRGE